MIKVGIDIIEINRVSIEERLIKRILHTEEIELLNAIEDHQRKLQFLAGRWAVKEAIFKAIDINIAPHNINVSYLNNKPIVKNDELEDIQISISHERNYALAIAIKP